MSWAEIVASLPTTTLEELNESAALLTRVDRKYVVRPEDIADVLAARADDFRALEIGGRRAAAYQSVYYDTPDLTSYLTAARRRPRRFKIRTREYMDTQTTAIEVKLRSARGTTVKHRIWMDAPAGRGPETPAVMAYAATFPEVAGVAHDLRPTLTTAYLRSTLVSAGGRITIDSGVRAEDMAGHTFGYGDVVIVETKTLGGACPLDRDLWAAGIRPVRISKYATSLAALHPDLPANRWHRTLNRHAPNRETPTGIAPTSRNVAAV